MFKAKSLKFKVLLCAASIGFSLTAVAQVYNEATRQLTLPNVQVGNVSYPNVVIRLDSFAVLAAGAPVALLPPPISISFPECSGSNFSLQKYNLIQPGQTLQAVTENLGCKFTSIVRTSDTIVYSWNNTATLQQDGLRLKIIDIYFDAGTNLVSGRFANNFKTSAGF